MPSSALGPLHLLQEELQRRSGAHIVTRGRFVPPGQPVPPNEEKLHLRITPAPGSTAVGGGCVCCVCVGCSDLRITPCPRQHRGVRRVCVCV